MRASSLIPYLCKETSYQSKVYFRYSSYIDNKFIFHFYKDKRICSFCNINCCNIICYLSNYSSKIICYEYVYYNLCRNSINIYNIHIDGKMIKNKI